jgi:hypothetical protein
MYMHTPLLHYVYTYGYLMYPYIPPCCIIYHVYPYPPNVSIPAFLQALTDTYIEYLS